MKVAILGSGAWGTALGNVLSDNKHEVLIYGINENEVNDINLNHKNSKFFNETILNASLKATTSISYCLKDFLPEVILLAVPSSSLVSVCEQIKNYSAGDTLIINVAKGLDGTTFSPLSDTIKKALEGYAYKDVVTLIGPSFALEVANKEFTLISAVSKNLTYAEIVQKMFSNQYFRVYTNDDEIGAQYGACIKNVIAIASGICSGLGFQDNARAALITRGLHEMTKFGVYKGGKKETYLGLTGIGDLFLTCTSFKSRNFSFGYAIGQANDATEVLKNNSKTVEGVKACAYLYKACQEYHVEMPIVAGVYHVLFEKKSPREEIISLMNRDLKRES